MSRKLAEFGEEGNKKAGAAGAAAGASDSDAAGAAAEGVAGGGDETGEPSTGREYEQDFTDREEAKTSIQSHHTVETP